MNVSSRWCVTAVFALGALACSDPVPPPAQGAFYAQVGPAPSPPEGKACPSSSFTYDVPRILEMKPTEVLSELNYTHKIVDGEGGARVSCTVKSAAGGFNFSGDIVLGGRGLKIASGTLSAALTGTATMTVNNSERLSPSQLISPPGVCTINAAKANGNNFQAKAGSMWASFNCSSVELMPSSSCSAKGVFVLENCNQ